MFSPEPSGRTLLVGALTNVGAIAAGTAVYFALPLGVFGKSGTWAFVALFALGLALVSAAIVRQVRRFRSGAARLTGVLTSLYLAVLYFALSITSTVGFGDVHAAGQLPRAVVGVHLMFNLGFLGVAVHAVRSARC